MSKIIQNIEYGKEARERLMKGVEILTTAVKTTLGPGGRNVSYFLNGQTVVTKDGVSVAKQIFPADPYAAMGCDIIRQATQRVASLAGDGPQPLYSLILTPNGFKKLGDIKLNDEICGTNGTIQKVVAVYEKGEKNVWQVKFSNNRIVECSEDHTWTVIDSYSGKQKNLTLAELTRDYKRLRNGKSNYRYYVPQTHVEFEEKKVELDPYLLGVLLGDGCISSISNGDLVEIGLGYKKEHIISKLKFPNGISISVSKDKKRKYFRIKIIGKDSNGRTIKDYLSDLQLLGTTSHTKFIPKEYLYNTKNIREKLLQGLLDTDGTINKRGKFEYSTVSQQLASDFNELILGLGKTVTSYCRNRKKDNSFSNTPLHKFTELKGYKYGIKLCDITKLNKVEEMRCLKVSNEDHLYITDNYIVTHNTTSTTILAHAMAKAGMEAVDRGVNVQELQRGMLTAAKVIKEEVIKQSVPCTPTIAKQIALVSTNWDEELANVISEAIQRVGMDGSIAISDSNTVETKLEVQEGVQIDRGYLSPYFINKDDRGTCEFDNAVVLNMGEKLTSNQQLIAIFNFVTRYFQGQPLLIVAPEVDIQPLKTLIKNKIDGRLNCCAIKAPGYKDQQICQSEDLSLIIGGNYINPTFNRTVIKDLTKEDFTVCKKVIISRDSTTFICDKTPERQSAINNQVKALKELMAKNSDSWEMPNWKKRVARLVDGVATILVGANTESELIERQDRADDCLCAVRAAISEGVVPGGGFTLYQLRDIEMPYEFEEESNDFCIGFDIVLQSLSAPFKQILANASGNDPKEIVAVNALCATQLDNPNYVYNAKTRMMCDAFDQGILDPAKVVYCSIENACSAAGILLTIECSIVCDEEKKD